MACNGAYADAWLFVSYFCMENLITGFDDSGGVGNAFLTDSNAQFMQTGVRANVGMVLYNLTKNTSGVITAVSDTVLTATGVTWDNGNQYRFVPITGAEIAKLDYMLDLSAASIHAARAATGGCDCTLASWASDYLAQLNVVSAAIMYACPCSEPIPDDRKQSMLDWLNNQLELIRTGKLELCAGATGSEYPAISYAEHGNTAWNSARIIYNDILRSL